MIIIRHSMSLQCNINLTDTPTLDSVAVRYRYGEKTANLG